MPGTADDRYFEWLYSHTGPVSQKNPRHTFWSMLRELYSMKFRHFVRNDANRAVDGVLLRTEFVERWGHEGMTQDWMEMECSVLGMLIALSERLAFESYGETSDWFWKLMENVGLDKYNDQIFNAAASIDVADTMVRVMDRDYGRDGSGGLFPLRDARRDQRRVELWYQKEAYLLEGLRVHNGPRV